MAKTLALMSLLDLSIIFACTMKPDRLDHSRLEHPVTLVRAHALVLRANVSETGTLIDTRMGNAIVITLAMILAVYIHPVAQAAPLETSTAIFATM